MTARQYVEHTLGPTPTFELGMRPDALSQYMRPGWAPNTFTDGALQGHTRWAPWLALGGYAIWAVGKDPVAAA